MPTQPDSPPPGPVSGSAPGPERFGAPGTHRPHQPLSADLCDLLAGPAPPGGLTLNTLLRGTEGRGIFLLIVFLCLPFLTPVSIPGASTLLGGVILVLGVRLAFGWEQRLPRWMGERLLPRGFDKVLRASVRVLRFLEKWLIRPRRTGWLGWRIARCANGLVLASMAFALALPIPPVIPLTNTLPAYAILLLALSMMEEDGWMIWLGYAATLGTVIYFVAWTDVLFRLAHRYSAPIAQWLQTWI